MVKFKGLLYAIPLGLVLVALGVGSWYGLKQKRECEDRGGTYVKVYGKAAHECIVLKK